MDAPDGTEAIHDTSALINVDPDFYVPAEQQGGAYLRAFRVLFPTSA